MLQPGLIFVAWAVGVGAALLLLWDAIFVVRQQTMAVIERFGKFARIADPGINIRIPFIERISGRVDLRLQQLDVKVETKTKDNVFVDLTISIQFRVEDDREAVFKSFYKLSEPSKQIRSYVFDVVRAAVPKMELDTVFESKDEIAQTILENLQKIMSNYGFSIYQALVTDIAPDAKVKEAMNRINAAKRDKEAAEYEGEATRVRIVAAAKAEAESKKLQGQGTANQRIEIARGISLSAEELTKAGMYPDAASAILLSVQYMDMVHHVAGNSKTNVIMMPFAPTGGLDVMQQIIAGIHAQNIEKK
ncbi:MAG: SPFH domain-containing protein [Deltaproteobacteria bacterium]|jgi:regulator of protease activity HflC (stomatin/prohibitin superfamily)|nr:SPFH domain-containing protein [Deltaproteobacteria bacterium]